VRPAISREEAADQLRAEAASCRRLAGRARTEKGFWALTTFANQFDSNASRIDPLSERR
jgi:hypothetical protein